MLRSQGKRHQTNLAKRAALEAREKPQKVRTEKIWAGLALRLFFELYWIALHLGFCLFCAGGWILAILLPVSYSNQLEVTLPYDYPARGFWIG